MLKNTVSSRLVPAVLLVAPLLFAPKASAQVTGPAQSLVIDSATLDNKAGTISVEVTVTCTSTAAFAQVSINLFQTIGRKNTASNEGFSNVACGPTPTTSIIVALPNPFTGGNVGGGSAFIQASLFACDANSNCNFVEVNQTVKITG